MVELELPTHQVGVWMYLYVKSRIFSVDQQTCPGGVLIGLDAPKVRLTQCPAT